ncbi:MAG: hypothetical protein LBD06_03470 [Candidatus Accumulibacter sp.]|nr:hypothetical protein [Accumulibacter sp.]
MRGQKTDWLPCFLFSQVSALWNAKRRKPICILPSDFNVFDVKVETSRYGWTEDREWINCRGFVRSGCSARRALGTENPCVSQKRPAGFFTGTRTVAQARKPAFLRGWDVKTNRVVTEKLAGIDASKDTHEKTLDYHEYPVERQFPLARRKRAQASAL